MAQMGTDEENIELVQIWILYIRVDLHSFAVKTQDRVSTIR